MYIITPESNFSLFNIFRLISCCFHQSLIIKQFESIHFLSVFELLFVFHLGQQNFLMFMVNPLQVFLFLLLVIEKGICILFPDISLFGIDFLLLKLFLFFLIYLPCKISSHLCFLIFGYLFTPFLLLLFFSQLIFNMFHHFLILSSDLFFLILDY